MKLMLLKALAKLARLVLALVMLYACVVFYFALSERRLAFPRAIPHKEARAALPKETSRISCEVGGLELEGFALGDTALPTIFYLPDSDEDAAQFIAEASGVKHTRLLAFNYRGSGENKGKPSEETMLSDAFELSKCARALSKTVIFAGRGTGAILAAKVREGNSPLLLIDPAESVAAKISGKYRIFFPQVLVRTKLGIEGSEFSVPAPTLLLMDRVDHAEQNRAFLLKFGLPHLERGGRTLPASLDEAVRPAP